MAAIGIGLALAPRRLNAEPPQEEPDAPFRIVPVSETSAFVIAPHDDLGTVAYELTFANDGNNTTPGSSIGAPFGGWRWTGTHHLASVGDDPTNPIGTLHDDIGCTDSAMQANFGSSLFGGHYHGGIVLSSSDVPDLTSEKYVSDFSLGYEATISWPTGQTASVVYDLAIQPNGNLAGLISYSSEAAFTRVFLSMLIGNGFTHHSTDGETFTSSAVAGTYALGSNSNAILRQGSTGYEIEMTSDQTGLTNITNEIVSDGVRLKHYVRKTSAGGALGSVSMSRTIAFRQTEPDPEPGFEPITDTFDGSGALPPGYNRTHTGTATTTTSTIADGVWEVRAGTTPVQSNRWLRPLTGAKLDGETEYTVEIDYTSITASTGMVTHVMKDGLGSTSSTNLLPFNGGATSLNLSSSSPATAALTFTLPAGTNPHLAFVATDVAGRGVNIREVRIVEL